MTKMSSSIGAFFILVMMLSICSFTYFVLFVPIEDGDPDLDYYETNVNIYTYEGSDRLTVSEEYKIRFDRESGETYITKPLDIVDESTIMVWIDGSPASNVSYSTGRNATYASSTPPLFSYREYYGEFEINAFYKRESGMRHVIKFQYDLPGVVQNYKDCSDIYYKVYTNFSQPLKNLTVTVHPPSGGSFDQSTAKIFGHGDPNGNAAFSGGNAVFTSSNLTAGRMFEIRIVADPGILNSDKQSIMRYSEIMAEEQGFIDRTNKVISTEESQKQMVLAILLIFLVYLILRYSSLLKRGPKIGPQSAYDVPDIKPNVMARFANRRSLSGSNSLSRAISSTLLNLALMGVVNIREEKNDVVFEAIDRNILMSMESYVKLTEFEQTVFDLVFKVAAGGRNEITLTRLRTSLATNGYKLREKLHQKDDDEFKQSGYVNEKRSRMIRKSGSLPYCLVLIYAVVAFAIGFIGGGAYSYAMFGTIVLATVAVAMSIVGTFIPVTSLTSEGELEYAEAQDLKEYYISGKYAENMTAMDLPVWEHHLVYATALGVAEKVIERLELVLKAEAGSISMMPSLVFISAFHTVGLASGFTDIGNAARSALRSYVESSTGGYGGYHGGGRSGGGGGFSGGGGGGFGGGGGGSR